MKEGFRKILEERQLKVDSLVCVGIDPLEEKLPKPFIELFGGPTTEAVKLWLMTYVDATAPYALMFKPQRAYFEEMKCDGISVLRFIIAYIHFKYPDIPVFLDCKRGDISRTQEQYGVAHLIRDGADGMNFSPYMGSECLTGLLPADDSGKTFVCLGYTSNESARQTQEVLLLDNRHYWEFIVESALEWARNNNVLENFGFVMAAAYERPKKSGKIYVEHLKSFRKIVGDQTWCLMPGIGTQKGAIKESVQHGYAGPGTLGINSSSGLLFASQDYDYAEASAQETRKMRDEIRQVLRAMEAKDYISKTGTIIGLTREQIVAVDPDFITWRLTYEEFFYMAEKLESSWFYDYEALNAGRPGKHAFLKSKRCSNGFFNSHELLQYPNILEIMARQLVLVYKDYVSQHRLPKPTHVLGIPTGATKLGRRVAELLGLQVIEMEKDAAGNLQLISEIPSWAVILFVEDFCTQGTGFKEAVKVVHDKNSNIQYVPIELVILNRGGLMYIEVPDVGIFVIVPFVIRRVEDWKPGKETCPLCKEGSEPIKPKSPLENWPILTSSQRE